VPFFQFLDRCARSAEQLQTTVFDIPHLAQLAANGSARIGTKGLADLLSNPAATAALGSALCSMLKLTAAYTSGEAGAATAAAVDEKLALLTGQTRDGDGSNSPSSLFVAVELLPSLQQLTSVLMAAVQHAMQTQNAPPAAAAAAQCGASASSSSSSRDEQARASAVFLMVLLSQRLLALHEAAAGIPGMPAAGLSSDKADEAVEVDSIADDLVCNFMADVLAVLAPLSVLEVCLWTEGAAAADADGAATMRPAAAAAAATAATMLGLQLGESSSSGGGGGASTLPLRWQHLLQLHRSRKLLGAVTKFSSQWSQHTASDSPLGLDVTALSKAFAAGRTGLVSSEQRMQMQQMYQDAMDSCRTIVAVAPLPVVCNNPGCRELTGVSEAAAARYVCAGCACRYCSAACQAAGWRSHKKACRRMAACGMRVDQ
jgi:hypothetical protein